MKKSKIMEEEKNNEFKKETACLFYNFKFNNKEKPISTHISIKKGKINDFYNNINNYIEKIALTESNSFQRDSYGYYRHCFTKFLEEKLKKKTIKQMPKKKLKHFFQLHSKIHFGSFINSGLYLEGYENINKYDNIKSKISKSKNFSFIKDPKTIRYNKLPLDLYIPKEDSIKIKNLISARLLPKNANNNKDKNKNESLIRYSYDNGIFDNTIINNKKSVINYNNKKIYFINKNKLNEKNHIETNRQLSENNLKESDNLISEEEEKDKSHKHSFKTKYNIHKNLSDLNDIDSNMNQKNILINTKSYSQTQYTNIHRPKSILLALNKKIKDIKTSKKSLKYFEKLFKYNSQNKLKKINKLINKSNINTDPLLVIKDIKNKDEKIHKKSLTKKIYLDIKKRDRLLSLVENLKSDERATPMMFLNHLYEEYNKRSKEVIKVNSTRKKINKIYKSSEEGKLIKKKIDEKNNVINKLISKNKIEGIKLKNKYKKFDLVIDKINEENNGNLYNETNY